MMASAGNGADDIENDVLRLQRGGSPRSGINNERGARSEDLITAIVTFQLADDGSS